MKRFTIITGIMLLLFFNGCNNTSYDPGNDQLIYQNGVVINEPAPFLINNGLHKSSSSSAQIGNNPPAGTVYGQINSNDTYAATGGEILPDSVWIDNANNLQYPLFVFESTTISFDSLASVSIVDPINLMILNENDLWIAVNNDTTLFIKSLATDSGGSCSFLSVIRSEVSEDEDRLGETNY